MLNTHITNKSSNIATHQLPVNKAAEQTNAASSPRSKSGEEGSPILAGLGSRQKAGQPRHSGDGAPTTQPPRKNIQAIVGERQALASRRGGFDTKGLTPLQTEFLQDSHVGGASSSRSRDMVSFTQAVNAACVPYSAAWLHQISNKSGDASSRMNFLSQDSTVTSITTLQQSYRAHELEIRGHASQFTARFQPTFDNFGISLRGETVFDVSAVEDSTMNEIAAALSEKNSSHVIVIRRTDGDDHLIAFHQSGSSVKLFDPNNGEFKLKKSEVANGIRNVINAYSQRVPVPELRVIKASV